MYKRQSRSSAWERIHLEEDPFEENDLAKSHPEKVPELEKKWTKWAEENQVLPLNPSGLSWNERIDKYTEFNSDQDGRD